MADDQQQQDRLAEADDHHPDQGHGQDRGHGLDRGHDQRRGLDKQDQDKRDPDKQGEGKADGNKGEDKEKQEQERKQDEQRKKARPVVRIILVLVLVGLVAGGFYLWWTTRNVETTDDAYTTGRVITVAPHVSGYVVALDVNDNQYVHEGQILARIDPRNYQATVDQDQAQVRQAEGELEAAKFRVEVSRQTFPAQLEQAKGQLQETKGQAFQAETDYRRQHGVARAATSQQAIDQSTAALQTAEGQVAVAQAQVEAATPVTPNIGVTKSTVTQQAGALEIAQAALEIAKLNLGWTVIRAPHDGWIAQRSIEQGNYVNSGQALFSIVQPDVWITANFKETQLTRMHAGQLVDISVDAYPAMKLHGHVDSVQLGSGEQFSAFPPENATGNYVKIVQRVPVKIVIDSGLDPDQPLAIGLSVEPTVSLDKGLAH